MIDWFAYYFAGVGIVAVVVFIGKQIRRFKR